MPDPLAYYATQSAISDSGKHSGLFDGLPSELPALCEVVQGLVVHPAWAAQYGLTPEQVREDELQLRFVAPMLERIIELDDRPLTAARPPETRLVGNCRDHTMLLCSMLRHRGVPARARCGFGAYFLPGRFEDHWVCEYWDAAEQRWRLVDGQLDAYQRKALRIEFDTCDVPRDGFIVAGMAWEMCRRGEADPESFGLSGLGEHGLWWVRDNLVRDVAAQNKMELLPWDAWGLARGPEYVNLERDTEMLDRAADLSQRPEAFAELQSIYRDGDGFRVTATIRSMGPGGGREVAMPAGSTLV